MIHARDIYPELQDHLDQTPYSILTGARQTGKTSLLRLLFQHLRSRGEQVFFLSLEDPLLLATINEHPNQLLRYIPQPVKPILEGKSERRVFALIDEIQYARDPSHFLKFLYDTYEWNLKVVATGSSAFYIDKKFRDSLAGRKRIFQLNTLNFHEFLRFSAAGELVEEARRMAALPHYQSLQAERLRQYVMQYMTFGGYPAVVLATDQKEKIRVLEELKTAYVKRDADESGVEKPDKFFTLFRLLADQTTQLLNKQELAATLGLDSKTVDHYLHILQKCFHIQLVKPYYRNLRKELTKMPKAFFHDLGLRNSLLNRFEPMDSRTDKGQLLENYFFTRLRDLVSADQIKFWRTTAQQEVDFVVETAFEQGVAFEIKWDTARFSPGQYRTFLEAYPHIPLRCLGISDIFLPPSALLQPPSG